VQFSIAISTFINILGDCREIYFFNVLGPSEASSSVKCQIFFIDPNYAFQGHVYLRLPTYLHTHILVTSSVTFQLFAKHLCELIVE
jgi:hypothetical protein